MIASCRSKNTVSSRLARFCYAILLGALSLANSPSSSAQSSPAPAAPAPAVSAAQSIAVPSDYIIGADDVLSVLFWRDKDLSGDVTVRPDGRISLPLVNEMQAAGLTPDQLRDHISKAAAKYVDDPTITVVVKQINSRKVFITGQVAKPGAYTLNKPISVLQLISMAGGLLEFAKKKDIVIARTEGGQPQTLKFNYKDALQGKNLSQNILLRPGDTILVP